VVMDNLGAHKPERVQELIEEKGCRLWFLPAYSSNLSPIEEAFSKRKELLKKAVARTRQAFAEEAIAEAFLPSRRRIRLMVRSLRVRNRAQRL
jgi:transposase